MRCAGARWRDERRACARTHAVLGAERLVRRGVDGDDLGLAGELGGGRRQRRGQALAVAAPGRVELDEHGLHRVEHLGGKVVGRARDDVLAAARLRGAARVAAARRRLAGAGAAGRLARRRLARRRLAARQAALHQLTRRLHDGGDHGLGVAAARVVGGLAVHQHLEGGEALDAQLLRTARRGAARREARRQRAEVAASGEAQRRGTQRGIRSAQRA